MSESSSTVHLSKEKIKTQRKIKKQVDLLRVWGVRWWLRMLMLFACVHRCCRTNENQIEKKWNKITHSTNALNLFLLSHFTRSRLSISMKMADADGASMFSLPFPRANGEETGKKKFQRKFHVVWSVKRLRGNSVRNTIDDVPFSATHSNATTRAPRTDDTH